MNKLKGIILVVSICFASIMMPFNIYADQLPQAEIVGVDYNLISYSQDVNNSGATFYNYTYEVEVKLKDNYVGVVDGTLSYTWQNQDTSTGNPTSHTSSNKRKSYVNGNSFKVNISLQGTYSTYTGKGPLYSVSYLVDNSDTNVVKYQDLDSIDTVVNLLQDIYQNSSDIEGLETNQLAELQKIITNTSLAKDYLNTLTKLRQWNLPIESFVYNYYFIRQFETVTLYNGYYEYPIYNVPSGGKIPLTYRSNAINQEFYCIFGINKNIWDLTSLNSYFSSVDNCEITAVQIIDRIDTYITVPFTIVKCTVKNLSNNTGVYRFGTFNTDVYIVPIYLNEKAHKNISTDFALRYGLSNSFLDNINTIANGNTASNNASQQLDSDTSDFNTDRDDLIDIEDSMGNSMDSAMNQITPNNNGLSGFGGNFLTSAVWVRTQFERLTNNTPYGSLIVYGMTLGLALLLLGKVML